MSNARADARILRGMEAQLRLRQARLDAGEKAIGWKVGFGAPAALERLQLDAPLIGFLTDRVILSPGSAVPVAGWVKPALEPEIAVTLREDLLEGSEREQARAAIASIGPAFELADIDFPPDDVEAVLAGNIYNRHVIPGRQDNERAGCNLEGLLCRVRRNKIEIAATTDLQALTGDIPGILVHMADLLPAFGQKLRAGEIVIMGSIIPPLWLQPPEEIQYDLEPIGTLALRIEV
jgi:2-keto-4-pentenoate hydratase